MTTLGICIPTYNRFKYLKTLISELINLDNSKVKIFVSDNCSTDETPQYLESLDYCNVYIYSNKFNIGGAANMLRVVEYSSCDFSWFLGDDEYISRSDIEKLIHFLQNTKYDSIFIPKENIYNSRKDYTDLRIFWKNFFNFESFMYMSSHIIRTSFIKEHILFCYQNLIQLQHPYIGLTYLAVKHGTGLIIHSNSIFKKNYQSEQRWTKFTAYIDGALSIYNLELNKIAKRVSYNTHIFYIIKCIYKEIFNIEQCGVNIYDFQRFKQCVPFINIPTYYIILFFLLVKNKVFFREFLILVIFLISIFLNKRVKFKYLYDYLYCKKLHTNIFKN